MDNKHRVKIGLNTVLPTTGEIHWLSIWNRKHFPKVRFGLFGVTIISKTDKERIFVPYKNIAYISWTVE